MSKLKEGLKKVKQDIKSCITLSVGTGISVMLLTGSLLTISNIFRFRQDYYAVNEIIGTSIGVGLMTAVSMIILIVSLMLFDSLIDM